jgi:3-oxoacyl-[acyl-carrier protein] reductase
MSAVPAGTGPAGPGEGHQLLAGKTVLVTAAAGTGIGFTAALRCAAEGATVAISDRHERRLAQAATSFGEQTGKLPLAVACDGTVQQQVDHLIDTVEAELGPIDVLINNVGLGGEVSIVDMTDDQWSTVLDVTLTATFRATRAVLRHMVPRRRGVIVNNASVLGWRAQAGQAHYAAAKAGVMALTRCAALDVAEYGIRINAVSPSIVMHPFLANVTTEEKLAELVSREAFGRAAEPWEVANVMVFLASDYSSYMTGEVVSVSSQHA